VKSDDLISLFQTIADAEDPNEKLSEVLLVPLVNKSKEKGAPLTVMLMVD
jgi:hypothetical protein